MNRREFLATTSGLFFLNACAFKSGITNLKINSNTKFVIAGGKEKLVTKSGYILSEPIFSKLLITQLNGEQISITTPGKGHEVVKHPIDNNILFASSKWGKEAYLADVNKKILINEIKTNANDSFYGHSLFSSDGQYIFATMMDEYHQIGFISVRETKSLKEIKRIPTFGTRPHQLRWLTTDRTIAVLNANPSKNEYGNYSLLNFIEIQKSELIKSFKTSTDLYSHFTITQDGSSAIACRVARKDHTLYEKINLKNGNLTLTSEEYPLTAGKIESLSHILIEEKSLAIMTIIGLKKIVIWNYQNNKIIFSQETNDPPQGIAISEDKKQIFVTFNAESSSYINLYYTNDFLANKLVPFATVKGGNGSHLTII